MKSVWILTQEYNQYDQYGEYFRAVFSKKPTEDQLKPHLENKYEYDKIPHILNGGGRQGNEDWWYYLREEKC